MLGKGDPNIAQNFFEFTLIERRTQPPSRASGFQLMIVENQRPATDYIWLTNATVEIDGELFFVEEVVFSFGDVKAKPANRVGEQIGLFARKL